MVLCAEKAEPVAADRAVGFAVPQQAGGLVCLEPLAAARVRGQPPAGTVGACMGGACTRAPSLCDFLGVQVCCEGVGNTTGTGEWVQGGWREPGMAGKAPSSSLVFLGCCLVGLMRLVSGERALARPVLVTGKKERGSGCELTWAVSVFCR